LFDDAPPGKGRQHLIHWRARSARYLSTPDS